MSARMNRRTGIAVASAAGLLAIAGIATTRLALSDRPTSAITIVAERPSPVADLEPATRLVRSILDVPVEISVDVLLDEVEAAIPREWVEEDVEMDSSGTSASLVFTRGPIRGAVSGQTATLAVTVAYALQTRYGLPLLPDVPLSCGTDEDDPAPRIDVELESLIDLTASWRLATDTRVMSVGPTGAGPQDRCELSILDIDVTDRVADGIREYLRSRTSAIDSLVAEADLRSSFERWWALLDEPIALGEGAWLTLRPAVIGRGTIAGSDSPVRVAARLEASPTVVLGSRPEAPARPLPPLQDVGAGDGLEVLVEAIGEYESINRTLSEHFVGRRVEVAGRQLIVEAVGLDGIGGGQVALATRLAGDVEGTLYFVGTPVFDRETGLVGVPDVSLSVATSNALVGGASWVLDAGLEQLLRAEARWPIDEGLAWAEARLDEGLNAELASGVRLEGSVSAVRVLGVTALSTGLLVRSVVEGNASLLIDARHR